MNEPVYSIVEGRRPQTWARPAPKQGCVLGVYFAEAAYCEAASAVAFERLAYELAAYDAPEELVEACERARVNELRHAARLARVAEAFGVEATMPRRTQLPIRPLVDIAMENAVEGVVRQTYGAAAASFRARTAEDPDLRALMASIARDEHEHAELAFEIARWLQGAIDPIEGALVEDAMRHAARRLARELDVDPDPVLCAEAGVPGRLDALAIWSGLSHRVWHGLSERVWDAAA